MSERLYYENAYLRHFEASVIACQTRQDGPWLALDRSAFYPTSGGQPFDTGILKAAEQVRRVLDVQIDDEGNVWHRTDAPLVPGALVQGNIDWPRRFDHMQQHGGEHILAGSLYALYQGYVHGLHVSADVSTIDVTLPDGRMRLSNEEITALETLANHRVQLDAPIRCWFPSPEELQNLPLRKEPTVEGNVRVVAAGDFEMVACGGTHPNSTGQIGLIKVLDSAPSRGKMRLTFVCGARAIRHYQTIFHAVEEASALLSIPPEALSKSVKHLLDEQAALHLQLNKLLHIQAQARARELTSKAQTLPNGIRLIKGVMDDTDMEGIKTMASELIAESHCVCLLAAPKAEGFHLIFACHSSLPQDMAALLKASGAKGGGRPDFAQGSAQTAKVLENAAAMLIDKQGST